MNVCGLGHLPQNNQYDGEYCELEFKEYTDRFDLIVYWYASGSYEGNGQCLARTRDGFWCLYDLGHCSCYGPEEALGRISTKYDTLDELKACCTDEYRNRELSELFDLAYAITKGNNELIDSGNEDENE